MSDLAAPKLTKTQQDEFVNSVINAPDKTSLKQAVNRFLVNTQYSVQEDNTLDNLQNLLKNKDDIDKDELANKLISEMDQYTKITGVENGYLAEVSVHPHDKALVRKVRDELMREFNDTSYTAQMTIDLAVTAYIRSLQCSKIYSRLLQASDGSFSLDPKKVTMLREIERQITVANQQYFTAMTFLKELHQPTVNVKVQTQQAYIGQNQQFNKNA